MSYFEDDGNFSQETSKRIADLSPEHYKELYKEVAEFLSRYEGSSWAEITLAVYMADLSYLPLDLVKQVLAKVKTVYERLPNIAVIYKEIEAINEARKKEFEAKDKALTAKCPFCDSVGFRYYALESSKRTATRKCTHKPEVENQPKYACALPVVARKVDNQEQIPFDPKTFFKGAGRSFPR